MKSKKNYIFFLVSLISFILISCSSSDDESVFEEVPNSKKEIVGFSIEFPANELDKDSLGGALKKDAESKAGSRADFSTIYLINGSNQSLPLTVSADVASFTISVQNKVVYGSGGGANIPLTGDCYLTTTPDGKAYAVESKIKTPNGKTAYSPYGDRLFKSDSPFTFTYKYNRRKKNYTYNIKYKRTNYEGDKNGKFGSLKVNLNRLTAKITTNLFIYAGLGFLSSYDKRKFEKDTQTLFEDWSFRTFIKGAPNVYNQEGSSILSVTDTNILSVTDTKDPCSFMDNLTKFFTEGSIWVDGIGYESWADSGSHIFPMSAVGKELRVSFYYSGSNPKFRKFNTLPIALNSFNDGGLFYPEYLTTLEPDVHYTLDIIFHKQDLIDNMQVPKSRTMESEEDDEFGPIMHIPYQVRLVVNKSQDN